MTDDVYVLTLQLDTANFDWLQALRLEHFPKSRNWLPAHLTLLHKASTDQIRRLRDCWSRFNDDLPLAIRFVGIRSLGGGTAVVVESPRLELFRKRMMEEMTGHFSRQDLQPFKAHVTIQNKVDHTAAKSLQEHLLVNFSVREGFGCGVMIWRYLNGPWSLDTILRFKESEEQAR